MELILARYLTEEEVIKIPVKRDRPLFPEPRPYYGNQYQKTAEERRAEIEPLAKQGLNIREIGDQVGLKRTAVKRYLHDLRQSGRIP